MHENMCVFFHARVCLYVSDEMHAGVGKIKTHTKVLAQPCSVKHIACRSSPAQWGTAVGSALLYLMWYHRSIVIDTIDASWYHRCIVIP